ncbi:hypothetical protein EXIGLDRAFT_692804 [Exidia glandulosa HHB12029]|uniref:Uncharacterized protein n=1 Tax=Exidia glandulosa HHB12029 TaxID=1314781 RepID=A0A166MHZ4_EXIGL|nr:hypothetical protein EXIGLDRAFT_692804 [Exidia glandulosa HHB12029]
MRSLKMFETPQNRPSRRLPRVPTSTGEVAPAVLGVWLSVRKAADSETRLRWNRKGLHPDQWRNYKLQVTTFCRDSRLKTWEWDDRVELCVLSKGARPFSGDICCIKRMEARYTVFLYDRATRGGDEGSRRAPETASHPIDSLYEHPSGPFTAMNPPEASKLHKNCVTCLARMERESRWRKEAQCRATKVPTNAQKLDTIQTILHWRGRRSVVQGHAARGASQGAAVGSRISRESGGCCLIITPRDMTGGRSVSLNGADDVASVVKSRASVQVNVNVSTHVNSSTCLRTDEDYVYIELVDLLHRMQLLKSRKARSERDCGLYEFIVQQLADPEFPVPRSRSGPPMSNYKENLRSDSATVTRKLHTLRQSLRRSSVRVHTFGSTGKYIEVGSVWDAAVDLGESKHVRKQKCGSSSSLALLAKNGLSARREWAIAIEKSVVRGNMRRRRD